MPALDSSGPNVIFRMLRWQQLVTLRCRQQVPSRGLCLSPGAGREAVVLLPSSQTPKLGGLNIPQRRGLPAVLFGSSTGPNKPRALFSPQRSVGDAL